MKSIIIEDVEKEEFEKLKQKYSKALISKRKNGSERIFAGNKIFVLRKS